MKKNIKTFTTLLFAALSLVSCKNNFSELENEIEYTNEKAYLTFGINESEERMAAPSALTWDEVNSIELNNDGSELKTWTTSAEATAYEQMKTDTSVEIDVGTYNFEVLLKDSDGNILQTGKLQNVEIKVGKNPLYFTTKAILEGNGNITVGIKWLSDTDAKYIKKASIKFYDMENNPVGEIKYLDNPYYEAPNTSKQGLYGDPGNYNSIDYENITCGDYFAEISFIVEDEAYEDYKYFEKKTRELVEVQNKRNTTYVYEHKLNLKIFPVEFIDQYDYTITFIEGYKPPVYSNEKKLPSKEEINLSDDNIIFEGWYVNDKKITDLDFEYSGKCKIIGKFRTFTDDLDNIPSNDAYIKISNFNNIDDINDDGYFDINDIAQILRDCSGSVSNVFLDLSELQIEAIDQYAFQDCTCLSKIALPLTLAQIKEYAFSGCTELTEITIPQNVYSIKQYVFDNCPKLSVVEIESDSSLGELPDHIFGDNEEVKLIVPYDVKLGKMPECKYICTIPSDITEIEDSKFESNTNLYEIIISSNVEKIGKYAFMDCENLVRVKFESNSRLTEIEESAFKGCFRLQNIAIPQSVTTIGDNAFEHCESFTNVEMPESVTNVGDNLFTNCSELNTFTIYYHQRSGFLTELKNAVNNITVIVSNGTKTITENAFAHCDGLKSIIIPASVEVIENAAFQNCTNLETVTFAENSKLETIGNECFYNCTALENITLPESLKTISDNAFYWNNLKNISLPSKLTKIGAKAFACNCCLEQIIIPSSVTSIGDGAFYDCLYLSKIEMPESVVEVGEDLFENCDNLHDFTIYYHQINGFESALAESDNNITVIVKDGTEKIESFDFFECYSLKEIKLSDSVQTIENNAFNFCTGLTSITIPANVKTLDVSAFRFCENLETVTFAENSKLESIGDNCFADCTALKNINLPESLKTISANAFENCSSLETLTLPANLESIGKNALCSCQGLSQITIPSKVTSIGDNAFENCKLTEIEMPASVVTVGDGLFKGCDNLKQYKIYYHQRKGFEDALSDGENSVTVVVLNETEITSESFDSVEGLKEIQLSDSVQNINNRAFYGCTGLTSITIPANVTMLGNSAFQDCYNLTTVTFAEHSKLETIGNECFYNCTALTNINLPESLKTISDNAFENCSSLETLTLPANLESIGANALCSCQGLSQITIPSKVTSIGDHAFFSCSSLTEIEMPASVVTVGENLFADCNNLNEFTIYYHQRNGFSSVLQDGEKSVTVIMQNEESVNFADFQGAIGLKEIILADSIQTIENSAFDGCTGLTSITIPANVKSLGQYAFCKCSNLETVKFVENSKLESIGDNCFAYCANLANIQLPEGLQTLGAGVFDSCTSLSSITIPKGTEVDEDAKYGFDGEWIIAQ